MPNFTLICALFLMYGGFCWLTYGLAHWAERQIPALVYILGLALLCPWVLLGCIILVVQRDYFGIQNEVWPPLVVVGIFLSTFGMGGWLHRCIKRAESGVELNSWLGLGFQLFYYALFLLLSRVLWLWLEFLYTRGQLQTWNLYAAFDTIVPNSTSWRLILCIIYWYSPFGAPLLWWLIARLRRGLQESPA